MDENYLYNKLKIDKRWITIIYLINKKDECVKHSSSRFTV